MIERETCEQLTSKLHAIECQLADLREQAADLKDRIAECSFG